MAPRGYSLKNLVPYSGWLWRAFVNALIENDEKVASSQNVHNSRPEWKKHTLFEPKMAKKIYTLSGWPGRLKNHTLWAVQPIDSPYKGISPPGDDAWTISCSGVPSGCLVVGYRISRKETTNIVPAESHLREALRRESLDGVGVGVRLLIRNTLLRQISGFQLHLFLVVWRHVWAV